MRDSLSDQGKDAVERTPQLDSSRENYFKLYVGPGVKKTELAETLKDF